MQVRAIRDCFVGSYRKADEEFSYDGPKNTNLEPLDGAKWPKEKPAPKIDPDGLPASQAAAKLSSDGKEAQAQQTTADKDADAKK